MSVQPVTIDLERRRMEVLAGLPLRRGSVAESRGRTDDPSLTKRQGEVLDGLIRGLTNKEIAAELGIGPDAVKRTISRLLIKLNVASRTALVQVALRTSAARLGRSSVNALSVLDGAPIPVLMTRGAQHRIEYANEAARSMLGIDEIGGSLIDAFPFTNRDSVAALADGSMRGAGRSGNLTIPLDLTGAERLERRRATLYVSPLRDGAGKLAGLMVFIVHATHVRSAST